MKKSNTYDESDFRDDNFYYTYVNSLRKYKLLSSEEEKELFIKLRRENDEDAKRQLIESNLRLVYFIAIKYRRITRDLMAAIQEGNLGLVKAIDTYDINSPYRFSTYAYKIIKSRIAKEIFNKSKLIHIPLNFFKRMLVFKAKMEELENKLGRKLSIKELSDYLNISYEKAYLLYKYSCEPISLEDISNNHDKGLILHDNKIDKDLIEEDMVKKVHELITSGCLKERELDILLSRIGIGQEALSLQKTGEKYHISAERTRQLYCDAIKKLRKNINIDEFRIYIYNELNDNKRRNK